MALSFAVKDELFDAQTLRAASAAIFGGADLYECIAIARRVKGDDLASWHDEWKRAGDSAYSIGVTAEANGQVESARLAFVRATAPPLHPTPTIKQVRG